MTILLKSDVIFTGSVGNLHGYKGPSDFRAMLDFSRENYFIKTGSVVTGYSISQAITLDRSSGAEYVDRYGNFQSSLAGSPRIRLLPDVGIVGLSCEYAGTNLIPTPLSPINGQVFTVTAATASVPISLSYYGDGSASIAAPELTLVNTFTEGNGRTVKVYTRSVSTAFSATLSYTGSISRAQCEIGYGASTFVSGARLAETIKLNAPFKDLFASGAGTIIVRGVYNKAHTTFSAESPLRITAAGKEFGGASLVSSNTLSTGTATVRTALDGGASGGTIRATVTTGNQKRAPVYGIGISGLGESARVIQFGKTAVASGLTTLFSAPDKIEIGAMGGIITHVVMYDRMLTEIESQVVANQWMAEL